MINFRLNIRKLGGVERIADRKAFARSALLVGGVIDINHVAGFLRRQAENILFGHGEALEPFLILFGKLRYGGDPVTERICACGGENDRSADYSDRVAEMVGV